MFMIVGGSIGRTRTVNEVARELSLNLSHFDAVEKLERLLGGDARRIVLLAEPDLSDDVITALERVDGRVRFGLIIAANPEALRISRRAVLLDHIAEFTNVEWIEPSYDVDSLSQAARECRRRMLTVSRRELEEALINREFIVQYQPKVDRGDGVEWITREAEALIRWRHPEHGLLGPLEFLPEAEAFDLIGPISEFVLYETAAQLIRWRARGLDLNGCINLASSLLLNPQLPDSYESIVRQHDLDCGSFTFEITEQEVASSDAPHLRVLNALREKGFRISLDDFGVAAASLGTFERIPVDEIKIHATALARAKSGDVAQKVLAAVTGLAHNLGIAVCAEGVEDQETFDFLKTIDCDKMQGFLISEAVMPDIIKQVYNVKPADVDEVA